MWTALLFSFAGMRTLDLLHFDFCLKKLEFQTIVCDTRRSDATGIEMEIQRLLMLPQNEVVADGKQSRFFLNKLASR
jgi:hypothetical protein